MKALRHLNKYLVRYKRLLIIGTVFTIVANALSVIPARLIKHAFGLVQESITGYQNTADAYLQDIWYEKLFSGLLLYGGLMLLAAVFRGLFSFLARWTIMVVGKRIEYALKNEIYAHYQTLPLSFYRRNSTGDLMARISEDVNQVGMYLGPAIAYGLNTAIIFLLLFPYMLRVNASMTLYTVPPILLLAAGTYYISAYTKERSEAVQHKLSGLTTFVQESFSGIRVLQAFTREARFTQNFAKECDTYKTRFMHLTAINTIFFPAVKSIIGLGTILVIFMGGQEVIQGKSTPGSLAEFIMYLNLLGWPIFSISWVNNMVQRAAASQTRINAFLQEKNPIISKKFLKNSIQGHIAFKNVSFTYTNTGVKALQSVTLEITTGKTIAIIGPTGAGKSTIAHLINRLYDAEEGEITIDGIPIQDYDVSCLRQQLGYVPQDVFLFSDTFKNNIAWGNPEATTSQITQVAKLAEIYENIQQFPNQMETMVGERGVTLSGGQKQRISIARALIRTPKILILDDCLSAVDTKTESKILRNITHMMQGKTMLFISPRVTSAQFADQILVLKAGELVEKGTHKELLATKGAYYTLYKQQQYETKV